MSYEPLKERLTKLKAAASPGVPYCTTYTHEYAAVALALVEAVRDEEEIGFISDDNFQACRTALDALQAVVQ